MLAVRDADDTGLSAPGLDAGAVAVAVARSWAEAGREVLLVDADAHGSGLSGRIGAAARLALQPARRGLPSLIAARASLDAEIVARHCWLLPTSGGSVQLLGAPAHPDGARRSAGWLAEHARGLAGLAGRWRVVVSMPGPAASAYEPLLRAASQRLVLAVAPGTAPPGGLRAVLSAFWWRFAPDPVMRLRCFDAEWGDPNSPAAETSESLIGGVKRARPAALLGARSRRRDRVLLAALARVAGHLEAAGRPGGPVWLVAGANGLVAGRCGADVAAAAGGTPSGLVSGAGS